MGYREKLEELIKDLNSFANDKLFFDSETWDRKTRTNPFELKVEQGIVGSDGLNVDAVKISVLYTEDGETHVAQGTVMYGAKEADIERCFNTFYNEFFRSMVVGNDVVETVGNKADGTQDIGWRLSIRTLMEYGLEKLKNK